MRPEKDLLNPEGHIHCTPFKNPAWVFKLFLFGAGFIFQGCVVHHGNHNARHKTKTYSNKNYPRHQQQDAHLHDRAPKVVKKIPSYGAQHPLHAHQPPSHAKAYDVAKGRPFTEDEHPSSHGQGHKANKGKPHMGDEHPSSKGHDRKMGQGKPDKGNDHPSVHAKAEKGKPLWGDEPPASKGHDRQMGQGKPGKGDERPSSHAQGNLGHKEDKGKPLWGDESPSAHAKMDKGQQHPRLAAAIWTRHTPSANTRTDAVR